MGEQLAQTSPPILLLGRRPVSRTMWGERLYEVVRRPEYTGSNRCWPCTAANVVIALVSAGTALVAAFAAGLGQLFAGLAAGLLLVSSLSAIYLRGYLVPGTPTLTKRYFPEWLLRRFDKHPEPDADTDSDVDRERLLRTGGVVTDCEQVDDLCLTDEFRTAWRDGIERVRERDPDATSDTLAQVVGANPDAVRIERFEDGFVARADGQRVGQWESEAAYLADVAAAAELRERIPEWDRLSVTERGQLLSRLRVFLESCPDCGGPVELGQEVVESCCRSIDVVAVSCRACGVRLFETEQPG